MNSFFPLSSIAAQDRSSPRVSLSGVLYCLAIVSAFVCSMLGCQTNPPGLAIEKDGGGVNEFVYIYEIVDQKEHELSHSTTSIDALFVDTVVDRLIPDRGVTAVLALTSEVWIDLESLSLKTLVLSPNLPYRVERQDGSIEVVGEGFEANSIEIDIEVCISITGAATDPPGKIQDFDRAIDPDVIFFIRARVGRVMSDMRELVDTGESMENDYLGQFVVDRATNHRMNNESPPVLYGQWVVSEFSLPEADETALRNRLAVYLNRAMVSAHDVEISLWRGKIASNRLVQQVGE